MNKSRIKLLREYEGHTAKVNCGSFEPSIDRGSKVHSGFVYATGGNDKRVLLWRPNKLSPIASLVGHSESVVRVCVGTSAQKVVSASESGQVKIWDTDQLKQIRTFSITSNAYPRGFDFHPTSEVFALSTDDGVLRVWDTRSRSPSHELVLSNAIQTVCKFSSNGDELFLGNNDGTLSVLSLKMGKSIQQLQLHSGEIREIATNHPSHFSTCGNDKRIHVIENKSEYSIVSSFENEYPVRSVRFFGSEIVLGLSSEGISAFEYSYSRSELICFLPFQKHTRTLFGMTHYDTSANVYCIGAADKVSQLWCCEIADDLENANKRKQTRVPFLPNPNSLTSSSPIISRSLSQQPQRQKNERTQSRNGSFTSEGSFQKESSQERDQGKIVRFRSWNPKTDQIENDNRVATPSKQRGKWIRKSLSPDNAFPSTPTESIWSTNSSTFAETLSETSSRAEKKPKRKMNPSYQSNYFYLEDRIPPQSSLSCNEDQIINPKKRLSVIEQFTLTQQRENEVYDLSTALSNLHIKDEDYYAETEVWKAIYNSHPSVVSVLSKRAIAYSNLKRICASSNFLTVLDRIDSTDTTMIADLLEISCKVTLSSEEAIRIVRLIPLLLSSQHRHYEDVGFRALKNVVSNALTLISIGDFTSEGLRLSIVALIPIVQSKTLNKGATGRQAMEALRTLKRLEVNV